MRACGGVYFLRCVIILLRCACCLNTLYIDGHRVIVDESGLVHTNINSPQLENDEKLQSLCVGYWAPFALKLGLEKGLADDDTHRQDEKKKETDDDVLLLAIKNAWVYVWTHCLKYPQLHNH